MNATTGTEKIELPEKPRALRIAKIDVDVGRQRKSTMSRQFLAPVPGQGLIQLLW